MPASQRLVQKEPLSATKIRCGKKSQRKKNRLDTRYIDQSGETVATISLTREPWPSRYGGRHAHLSEGATRPKIILLRCAFHKRAQPIDEQ